MQQQYHQQNHSLGTAIQSSVTEQSIYQWFLVQDSWKRLNLMTNLLHTCHPIELRFILTIADDLSKPDRECLRGAATSINRVDDLKRKLKRKHATYNSLLTNSLKSTNGSSQQHSQTVPNGGETHNPGRRGSATFSTFTEPGGGGGSRSATPPIQMSNEKIRKTDEQLRYELFLSLALLAGDSHDVAAILHEYVSNYIDRKINAVDFFTSDIKFGMILCKINILKETLWSFCF